MVVGRSRFGNRQFKKEGTASVDTSLALINLWPGLLTSCQSGLSGPK